MNLVHAPERLVALPTDEKVAGSADEDVIVLEGVRMRYGATDAVAGIDLRVARGEIFARPGVDTSVAALFVVRCSGT